MRTPVGTAAWEPGASLEARETGGGSGWVFCASSITSRKVLEPAGFLPSQGFSFLSCKRKVVSWEFLKLCINFCENFWNMLLPALTFWLSPANIGQRACNRHLFSSEAQEVQGQGAALLWVGPATSTAEGFTSWERAGFGFIASLHWQQLTKSHDSDLNLSTRTEPPRPSHPLKGFTF